MARVLAFLFLSSACLAQPKDPCFAYLVRGDITVVCQGKTTQVTRRGNIQNFAVSDELASLAYITGEATATVVDLKSGASKRVERVDAVVSTCGGILPIPVGGSNRMQDVVTGQEVSFASYRRFRCSSDRKTVAGIAGRELSEGEPPATRIADRTEVHDLYFNVSPDGSHVAYFNDVKPLCVFAGSGPAQCVEHETMSDAVSVNDAGEVLAASGTGKGCVYKSAWNFTPAKPPDSGDDECLGIGYWKAGLPALVFLADLGRNPQWLRPETAKVLIDGPRQAKSR